MKKLWSKLKKSILFYTIIAVIIFIIAHFTLKLINVQFRQWVYYLIGTLVLIGIIAGIIQILKNRKKSTKFIVILCIVCILILFWKILLVATIIAFSSYKPEYVVEKDNKRYVANVNYYVKKFEVKVDYFDYINCFLVGNKIKIREDYGDGSYDPFKKERNDVKPMKSTYYDNNGKIIETNNNYMKN